MKNIFIIILISLTSSISYSQCVKGNCHRGHGTFNWENGSAYDGYWVDGKPHGFGDFMYENGDKYKGNFIAGKRSGIGKYTWKNGNTYDGHWKEGLTNGIGKYRWSKESATYEGMFKDGQLESVEIEASVESPEKDSK
jgi:hypothetical protein